MSLTESYTQKVGALKDYFNAILEAQAPERFSIKFLESLGFASTNDRLFISILKELGFLNADGVPQQRYFDFLDRDRSPYVLAQGIREAYEDLFIINKNAQNLKHDEIKNKLRTLYAGKKTDNILDRITRTFVGLCELAAFDPQKPPSAGSGEEGNDEEVTDDDSEEAPVKEKKKKDGIKGVSLDSLQYHINIVLPESREQAVYDAIFRSLREHLGSRNE